ncbi:MAG: HAD-IC family P-type ATPase [bacterium]
MSDFHSKSAKTCLSELKSRREGLTAREAEQRLKKNGNNELPKEPLPKRTTIFISQFKNPLAYILLIAGTLSLFVREYIDASVIFGAALFNSIIGYIQENKASQSMAKLRKLAPQQALVRRDGQEMIIDSQSLTVGDCLILKPGNRIPADGRIIECSELFTDESILTGESVPAEKNAEKVIAGASLADRKNMIYAGTIMVSGVGEAVITAVGEKTEMGKIAQMVKDIKEEKTPLQKRLVYLSKQIGVICAVISFVVVFAGVMQGRDFIIMMETGVALVVASVPEGLTMAVTFILALGAMRILKRRALVRNLAAAETLGSVTTICTDKTGTLTEGKMVVARIVIGEEEFKIENISSRQEEKEARAVMMALEVAMMCNDAVVENPKDDLADWRIIGSPTETALLSAAIQSGLEKDRLSKIEPEVDQLPFDSKRKFMLSLREKDGGKYTLYEKGAPEIVLKKSVNFFHRGEVKAIGQEEREKLEKVCESLSNRGLRVIGLGRREMSFSKEKIPLKGSVDWDELDNDLTFIGFIAIKDPLRPEVKETIETCRKAGIKLVIITGDHKLTAMAIACEAGLDCDHKKVMTGEELDKLDDDELLKISKKIDIYARVSPHHKLRIVRALKERGEVVAMTGDGINDSPALRASDIGISLGTGTDIAKENSDMVLLDNNFKTIVSAVKEGRVIFDNIRKSIVFLMSDVFSEVILIVGCIFLNLELALLPAQILWINILNDGLMNFSLAFEKGEDAVMGEKPVNKSEPLLNSEMKIIIFAVGLIRSFSFLLIFLFLYDFQNIEYLRTLIFAMLAVASLAGMYSIRSLRKPIFRLNPFSNKYLMWATVAIFSFLFLGIYSRFLQPFLHTTGLRAGSWVLIFGAGVFSIVMIEAVKYYYFSSAREKK